MSYLVVYRPEGMLGKRRSMAIQCETKEEATKVLVKLFETGFYGERIVEAEIVEGSK